MAPLAKFFSLSCLIDFFRGCWKYGPIIRKIIENVQFAVQQEIFQKKTFLPYHHLLWALLLRAHMHENSDPNRFFDPRRDVIY